MPFTELGLQQTLATRLLNLGYTRPASAHTKTIPAILNGTSLFVGSPSGAGFTESAMISIINLSTTQAQSRRAYIILSASDDHKHIYEQRLKLLMGDEIQIDIITNLERFAAPTTQATILISTPQEFHNYLEQSSTNRELSYTLLLTETDEMVARGAKPQLLALSDYLSKECQIIICTSKITKSVKSISRSLQYKPKWLTLGPNNKEPRNIAHQAWPVPKTMKDQLLLKLSSKLHNAKAIIIVNDQQYATKLARRMRTRKLKAAAVRAVDALETYSRFESNDIQMLILPDQLNRSISLEGVTHIIHYHLPDNPQDYLTTSIIAPGAIHMSIISPNDEERLIEIEDVLKRPLSRNILTNFDYTDKFSKSKHETTTRKKKRRKGKQQTKFEWDPDIPRTWGDQNAIRANPEKTPLEEWSPSPLPSVWLDKNLRKNTKSGSAKNRPSRRDKQYRRNHNGNKFSRTTKQ